MSILSGNKFKTGQEPNDAVTKELLALIQKLNQTIGNLTIRITDLESGDNSVTYPIYDGGDAATATWADTLDGGIATTTIWDININGGTA